MAQAKIMVLCLGLLISPALVLAKNTVNVWSLPAGTPQSAHYKVEASGKSAFVSTVAVLRGLPASFSSFDFSGQVQVKVTFSEAIKTFKIRPLNLAIQGTVTGNSLTFSLTNPANLTIEFNGSIERPLHLFANPLEATPPSATNANVLYFGPGLHEVSKLNLQSGQTIYLAPGAILKAIIPADEQPVEVLTRNGVQEKIYHPFIEVGGAKNLTIRGRGIIDLSGLPWHARKTTWFDSSSNILIEGITILDSPDWALVLNQCTNATIRNVKQISRRENSDGVDICNSQMVVVEDCFIRANDDGVCVKTLSASPAMKSLNITVRNCVIWNERARGMGITSETLADISDVTFENCDIIHDLSEGGDCSALAVLVSDSGVMSNIIFQNIRIEDSRTKLIRCWIGEDGWAQEDHRGKIKGVTFHNIAVTGTLPLSEMLGYSRTHMVENVVLNLIVNGKKITKAKDANLDMNDFVKNIRVVGTI